MPSDQSRLQIRHLLQGCGVEHVIRPETGEDRVQTFTVANIAECTGDIGRCDGGLAQDAMQGRL